MKKITGFLLLLCLFMALSSSAYAGALDKAQ